MMALLQQRVVPLLERLSVILEEKPSTDLFSNMCNQQISGRGALPNCIITYLTLKTPVLVFTRGITEDKEKVYRLFTVNVCFLACLRLVKKAGVLLGDPIQSVDNLCSSGERYSMFFVRYS